MITYLKFDNKNNLIIDKNKLVTIEGSSALMRILREVVRTQLGSNLIRPNIGWDYLSIIGNPSPNIQLARSQLKSTILDTGYVKSVDSIEFIKIERQVNIKVLITSNDNDSILLEELL